MPPISVTIFASDPGTYFLEDDGVPGNNFSRIRFPDGTTVAFEHPTDDLFFDPSVAGVTLVVNLTDSLGTSRFSTGDFADPLSTPDFIQVKNIVTAAGVTLIANNAITEGNADVGVDITASTLILSATTGVGTSGNAIETQVGVVEAETNTGGINLRNFGTVSIGGLTDDVDGLDVVTSGNLSFTTFGSMVISDESGPESVHGGTTSGNVTLTASGNDTDMIANVDQDSISAPHGNIVLSAGRDIGFGLIGSNFDNDIRASGSITFNPGRDLLLDGFADVASDNFGNLTGGDVIVNAGRNVTLLAVAGTDAGIEASGVSGGSVILNTGPGGTVTLNSGNGTAPFASLISQTGDIIINADRMSIGTNGAISTVDGQVTIQPKTEGWDVDLGSATDAAFALELSDAEVDRIFTSSLVVGSLTSGQLNVSSAISPLHAFSMTLRAGTDLYVSASMTIAGALTLRGADNVFQLGASAINVGGAFNAFVDDNGADDSAGGFGTLNGSITGTVIKLTGNLHADTLSGSEGNDELYGLDGSDKLFGFEGDDRLEGGLGTDTMTGGLDNDLYIVNNASDVVVEAVGEGNDTISTALSFTLVANVEELTLTGILNVNGVGNDLANILRGNGGNNMLDGGLGADDLRGGAGDDVYIVDNVGDTILEGSGNGNDVVMSSVTFTLSANVEELTLTGGSAINGTGNGSVNILRGNTATNFLDGGVGADEMRGGAGNDVYIVDNVGDTAVEGSGNGTDRVDSSVSFTLGSNVENLTLTGVSNVNGTGNSLANTILGNSGANQLDGGTGVDDLRGGAGNDVYIIDNAGDVVVEAGGNGTDLVQSAVTFTLVSNVEDLTLTGVAAIDGTGTSAANVINGNGAVNTLRGEGGIDTINGGVGDDQIFGGTGSDELTGGTGSDGFRFDTALNAATNVDDILDFSVAADTIFLDRDIFTGIAVDGTLAAGAFRAGIVAVDADDRILYDAATGSIRYDADGVGGTAAILFATVDPGLALTHTDFSAFI